MSDQFTPQNPPTDPAQLRRYGCPNCKQPLAKIKERGCMSIHTHKHKGCNTHSWGQLHKKEGA